MEIDSETPELAVRSITSYHQPVNDKIKINRLRKLKLSVVIADFNARDKAQSII